MVILYCVLYCLMGAIVVISVSRMYGLDSNDGDDVMGSVAIFVSWPIVVFGLTFWLSIKKLIDLGGKR